MPFLIIRQDITQMQVDAIVTAGGAREVPHTIGGVNGRIHRAAGFRLLEAIRRAGGIRTGCATITPGYELPCRYVIHTAGPVYQDGMHGESMLLRACYQECLKLAHRMALASIAFPLISSGSYGYPKQEAVQIATAAIRQFLDETGTDMMVYLVVYDREAFRISSELFDRVEQFIDQHYVDAHRDRRRYDYDLNRWQRLDVDERVLPDEAKPSAPGAVRSVRGAPSASPAWRGMPEPPASPAPEYRVHSMTQAEPDLEDMLSHLDEGFYGTLTHLMEARNMKPSACYKRANVDKKVFSKMGTNPAYTPKKSTAVAFCIALELNLPESRDLLSRAGYALSRTNKFDVIVEFFITQGFYDVDRINQVLWDHDMPLLGSNAG